MPTDSVKEGFFATKEERENLLNIGSSHSPVQTFKKSDYLTPETFAKKFRFNKELVIRTMRKMAFQNAKFVINGHLSNIVNILPDGELLAHPMALNEIKKQLMKPKVKQ
ncbi:MAG: hypothetical protein IKN73_03130 [Alphaproteobacteria bacterium]|nr:hypothetical protein [Alphaproteobacteria bacterium]